MPLPRHPSPRALLILAFCLSGAALLVAILSQYAFGLFPCHLCILQRYPHFAMLGLIFLLLLLKRPAWQKTGFWLCIALFLIAAAIGFYHAGVEKGWLEGPGSCTVSSSASLTVEQLREQILKAPIAFCDEPAFEWMGLTMASLHAIYCLFAVALLCLIRKRGKNGLAGIA